MMDAGKKVFCSYWLRHGECDYIQQGCKYLHEMPADMETLQRVGLREVPRWFRLQLPNMKNQDTISHMHTSSLSVESTPANGDSKSGAISPPETPSKIPLQYGLARQDQPRLSIMPPSSQYLPLNVTVAENAQHFRESSTFDSNLAVFGPFPNAGLSGSSYSFNGSSEPVSVYSPSTATSPGLHRMPSFNKGGVNMQAAAPAWVPVNNMAYTMNQTLSRSADTRRPNNTTVQAFDESDAFYSQLNNMNIRCSESPSRENVSPIGSRSAGVSLQQSHPSRTSSKGSDGSFKEQGKPNGKRDNRSIN
jgi:hypothetical protein